MIGQSKSGYSHDKSQVSLWKMKLTWLPWLFVIIAAALVVAKPLDRDPTALTTLVTRSINTATVNPIAAKPLTSRSVAAALAKGPCESAGTITKCALKAT